MTNKIYITYDNKETVAYSFWNQFFLMSGVWVIGNEIKNVEKDNLEEIDTEYLHIYLLSNKNISIIEERTVRNNVFYFINERHYKNNIFCQYRKDVLSYDWKKQYTFVDTLNQITYKEKANYSRLLNIYINNSLWMSTWLYFELACDEMTEWDDWIVKNSTASIKALNKFKAKNAGTKNVWNYEFMNLYCNYLKIAVEIKKPEERKEKVKKFLEEADRLSEKNGWQPALCKLCAEISELSPLENKNAVAYYKEILEYEKNPEILYKIGKIYEKNYGDIESAKKYYELADEDGKCYRARYKIASYYETNGLWKRALFLYESIMEYLRNRLMTSFYHSVTVYEIEYYEKILIKIQNIFQKNLLYSGQELDDLIEDIKKRITDISGLKKMIHCMRKMSNVNTVSIGIDENDEKQSEKQREVDFLKKIMNHVQKRIDEYF